MKVSQFGEFKLIERFASHFKTEQGGDTLGIGDDCSVIPWDDNSYQLATTDLLIEDVHFVRSAISPQELAAKSLAVNVSDIAAMGGKPQQFYLSLGLPRDIEISYVDQFFESLSEAGSHYDVNLLGGDTTSSPEKLIINILVQGMVERDRLKKRSAARPGDIICLTGTVGDSGMGLEYVLNQRQGPEGDYFVKRHHCPAAHLEKGRWLSQFADTHAMIDISDGVLSDLRHICEESQTGARIEVISVPLSNQLREFNPHENTKLRALATGEDYCLLVTLPAEAYPERARQYQREFSERLHRIGVIEEGREVTVTDQGQPVSLSQGGFDHFA